MTTAKLLLDLLRLKQSLETSEAKDRTVFARAYQSQLVTARRQLKEQLGREYTEQQLLDWAASINKLKAKRARWSTILAK
jgi:hypothetical protein